MSNAKLEVWITHAEDGDTDELAARLLQRAKAEGFDDEADVSLAVSGSAVALAISSAGQVGLALESATGTPAKNVYTRGELRFIESRPGSAQVSHALRIRAIKEAYARLLESGTPAEPPELDAIEVTPAPWRINRLAGHTEPDRFHLELHEPALGDEVFQLALVSRPRAWRALFATIRVVSAASLRSPDEAFTVERVLAEPTSVSLL